MFKNQTKDSSIIWSTVNSCILESKVLCKTYFALVARVLAVFFVILSKLANRQKEMLAKWEKKY